ncbi:MAG: Flagellar biosynthesis protein FlhA [Myxococcales bacterium]|nr:Flagellar biosynthesis protein FlhA [Myxococcales bacterium]
MKRVRPEMERGEFTSPRGVAELAIAALVIAVVVMLIVPLPRPLLDGLLTLNIGVAVLLLMASLFTESPLRFASFPTLLVVTTLFRVGLEVSTTRLVLADADAGSVVRAFGSSVVSGNLIVGLVVFAVITIVQLVVVARGAERVAEVAARFALDAMPGKQMAIDAELRTGSIDADTARKRRGDLERESQLYGAMDGAMRFVKGDAVAAIMIVVINLVGGLAIGIGSRGMTAGEAIRTYSLLSIGAGLVAQIPSLLVAVASGLLVTRVASSGDRSLGEDLGTQLTGSPRALAGAAILLLGLALVPGLPLAPFLLLGGFAAGFAVIAARARPRVTATLDEPGPDHSRITLRVSPRLHGSLVTRSVELHTMLAEVRATVGSRSGLPLAPLAVAQDSELATDELALALDGTPVAWSRASGDPVAALRDWLPNALAQLVPELIGVDRTAALVDQAAAHSPVLVREVVPRIVTLPVLADVLRQLAREQVPIDDIAAVLEAIALAPAPAGGFAAQTVPALVEHLRGQLRRQISARWAPRGQLVVYTVDTMIEEAVRTAIDRRDGGQVLALEPAIAHDIVSAVRNKLGDKPAVILASGDVRRHLRSLLEPELPEVAILSAHELAPGTSLTTAGRIDVA